MMTVTGGTETSDVRRRERQTRPMRGRGRKANNHGNRGAERAPLTGEKRGGRERERERGGCGGLGGTLREENTKTASSHAVEDNGQERDVPVSCRGEEEEDKELL
ncbi:hypothetical protein Q5P01_002406 [Channa striata]|uniref:Uncharacterized protein n=1 Tax=Channa striata TaxID=64152 RepID=A0AA88NT69_CHASR|nr:hypothetical protein Q5P01_002406 [Channa striata]